MQQLFGDKVCADAQLRRCDLIPEAQAWLDATNQAMAGGHCYGFSVLSELIWEGKVNASTLGASASNGLAIDDNQALQPRSPTTGPFRPSIPYSPGASPARRTRY